MPVAPSSTVTVTIPSYFVASLLPTMGESVALETVNVELYVEPALILPIVPVNDESIIIFVLPVNVSLRQPA